MKPFRIFRPGKHTASNGEAITFTETDLKDAVSHYNAKVYAAPLVIGHPKTEDRAYGWAETLSYEDGYVVAHPDKVDAKFAELVEQGAYRNRSASWYMPTHPNNPAPGYLYPKHIGFLGAVPPALKGLGDVQFAEELNPELVVEFADSEDAAWTMASFMSSTASVLRGLRDALLSGTAGNADQDAETRAAAADKLVPSYLIDDMQRQAAQQQERAMNATTATATPGPSFTEPNGDTNMSLTPEQQAAMEADLAAANAKVASFTERETAIAAAEHMATVASIERDIAPLVTAGRVLPATAPKLASFMASLDDKEQTIEFGEAVEGVTPKVSGRAFMLGFLKTLPVAVDFSEHSNNTRANSGALTPRQLAEKATTLKTKVKSDTGVDISFSEATNRVLRESGATVEDPTNTPKV